MITLFQGGLGVTTYLPVHDGDDGSLDGFVNAVFRIDTLVDSCLSEPFAAQQLPLPTCSPPTAAGLPPRPGRHGPGRSPPGADVAIFGQDWRLELAPSPQLLAAQAVTQCRRDLGAVLGVLLVVLLALLLRAHFAGLDRLAESQARYRLLVEHTGDMIVKVDPQGRFLYVSPSYCSTFGMSEDRAAGPRLHAAGPRGRPRGHGPGDGQARPSRPTPATSSSAP